MEFIVRQVKAAVAELWGVDIDPVVSIPEEQFGDASTNIAMQLAGQLQKNPKEVAEQLASKLNGTDGIAEVSVAGPGFINIRVDDTALLELINHPVARPFDGQEILVEFGDPNPFKEMHLGHLYTTVVGDSIARLFETAGANVKRLSYHGDVGRHVAMAIYGMKQAFKGIPGRDDLNDDVIVAVLNNNLGFYYAAGAKAFESDEQAAQEIRAINEHVYARDDDVINRLYDWGKDRSFGYFELIFEELGVSFDHRFFESESAEAGLNFVRSNIGSVFEESEGAVVYKGEKVGLHTRVFINSQGLPTYEAKDLGLAELKAQHFPNATLSIVITANEQAEYFKVMLAALAELDQHTSGMTKHISHGFLSLTTGKMSSRTGEVYSTSTLLSNVEAEVKENYPDTKDENRTYIAAVKYALIKHRIGGDIVFDVHESASLEGNSGPYLQYAYARACGILRKAEGAHEPTDFTNEERSLTRKLSQFSNVIQSATNELMPHHIATYLYELAQNFNSFYEHNRVIDDERQGSRLWLVQKYADTLKTGLNLLGIVAPDRM